MSKYQLGVMQGRLLPKYKGRYQAHPVNYWQKEFEIAKSLNLDLIEFIFDYNEHELNPLFSDRGINEISSIILATGVSVKTICADYFMESPLHSLDNDVFGRNIIVLKKLIENASRLNISDIVIPCVDQSSLKNDNQILRLTKAIKKVENILMQCNVNLSLETDLSSIDFLDLIKKINCTNVKINYDTGNSACFGYNLAEEFNAYGHLISDIHIKDRKLNGGSVLLGSGDINLTLFFDSLKSINFTGPIIFQVYRDDEGVSIFKEQLNYFNFSLNEYNSINPS
jgi:L-ribulose-5-phosphate 3-epimerase UlaE